MSEVLDRIKQIAAKEPSKWLEKSKERQQKQLLFDFFMFFRENGEKYLGVSIEKLIDIFIENHNK